jgi:DnaA family protein
MRQLLLDFTRAPAPTFANYVQGANAELLHALESAARGAPAERVVYMWGESGAGKTHLLKAFAAASGARYAQGDDLGEVPAMLAIDGIERMPEPDQIRLFNAFNEGAFRFLAVSARSAPRDVSLRRDLATRLATGLTYLVVPLTDREKQAALAAHAKVRGIALGEEVSSYLLTHSRRDMGSLVAALDCLDRYSLETGRPITVPLLKDALQLTL